MSSMTQSRILTKFNNETMFLKAILSKTADYYSTKKELLINLERGIYGVAVMDNNIITYEKEDLKRYTKDSSKFRELVFDESLKTAIYIIINKQFEKNKASLRDTKTRLKEKSTLNEMLKQVADIKSPYGKTNEEVKISAYKFYNSNYNQKININEKSLHNDIIALNLFSAYLNVISEWTANEIDELAEQLPQDRTKFNH